MVAGAGPGLEDTVLGGRPRELGHQGDQERRCDVLVFADRQRLHPVGQGAQDLGHEAMPWHGPQSFQQSWVEFSHPGLRPGQQDLFLDPLRHVLAKSGETGALPAAVATAGRRSSRSCETAKEIRARAFSVKSESPKMLYPFAFEPVLVRKPPTLFGNRL